MFRDILEFIGYKIKQVASSRLFHLSLIFTVMFLCVIVRLFQLQILEGEQAQEEYTQTTKKEVSLKSTRGNIYDRNGKLLATNKLVYSVTVTDQGDYSNGYEMNLMLRELVEILNKHNESLQTYIPIRITRSGKLQYTQSGNSLLRFLRDMYGLKSTDDFTDEKSADTTADEAFAYMKDHYGIGQYSRAQGGGTYDISDEEALEILNIRFEMSMNSYQKYVATTVSQDISTETMQDILEHSTDLLGVDVEDDYVREYKDAEEFSHIIGYTGMASSEEIETLNKAGGNYGAGDIIGKTGIESYCESDLQGQKGSRVIYVDNQGHIQSVESETNAVPGNDVYLTIDSDLQVGVYHLIEQTLAGIILDKLDSGDVTITSDMKSSERRIGIKKVYFQLINNNVLDMDDFLSKNATAAEQRLGSAFSEEQKSVLAELKAQLTSDSPSPYKDLDESMQVYMTYAYSALEDAGILSKDAIDTSDATYLTYHKDESISLQEFLRYALSQSWIDTSRLNLGGKYVSADDTYQALVNQMTEILQNDENFSKKIYEQMIDADKINPCDLCMALFDQGVLREDTKSYQSLEDGSSTTAYRFIRAKIQSLEITPAQLALDPCSGAVTLIDPTTGEVRAMVSYPGYDTNRISDSSYYYKLSQDESHPLYSTATQTRTAPGSTFKMVSTIAGLTEKVIDTDTLIDCTGVFDKQGLDLACTGTHGELDVVRAIQHSCNYFFSEVGYRLSLKADDTYSEYKGVGMIQKYASLVGFDQKSGVEVTESSPKVSDTAPIPSAIGQGTNDYTNSQLARYGTVMATSGTVYKLSLLNYVSDPNGKLIKDYSPSVLSKADVSQSIWDVIHKGMRQVVTEEHKEDFNQSLNIAGKTGTAEENKMRPNHAHFIGYAPYDNPTYVIGVTIPNGFSSTYACRLANVCMEYVFGQNTLDQIEQSGAIEMSGSISDE